MVVPRSTARTTRCAKAAAVARVWICLDLYLTNPDASGLRLLVESLERTEQAEPTGGQDTRAHDVWPVKTVARMTGLTADVIRAWEKRYGVVAPQRGPRGARLYTAVDIARLRLLGQAVSAGRAIGDVAALDPQTLQQMVGPDRELPR
jgi:hypothetical protein